MSTNMFVKFSNKIDGEAVDAEHPGWCEITSVEQKFTQGASPTDETTQDTSKAEHEAMKISKLIDKASTGLMKACWEGTKLDKVMIDCMRAAAGEAPITYFKVVLEKVIISEFEFKVEEGEIVGEDIELTAAKASYYYRPMSKDKGKVEPRMLATHDLKSNVIT